MTTTTQTVDDPAPGQVLYLVRTNVGLTLREVADLADVNAFLLGQVERGNAYAAKPWLRRVAGALGELAAERQEAQR